MWEEGEVTKNLITYKLFLFMEKVPRVGVAVILLKNNKVLLGKRKNAHGEGTWGFPGGHLEFNESIENCVVREVIEETGLKIKNIRIGTFTNDIFDKEGKHYITLFMLADYDSGKVTIMEPERMENWQWYSWDSLPKPLFLPIENLLKSGFNPLMT